MDNANNVSYIIQLMDSCSERGKSNTSNAECLASESLYKLAASDLAVALSTVAHALQAKGPDAAEFMSLFSNQIVQNQLPLIYKIRLTGAGGSEIDQKRVLAVVDEMVTVLEKLAASRISFSTESELISIFQMIFSEGLFETETFCLISSLLFRAVKETELTSWREFHYVLFINLFLLQFGTPLLSFNRWR